MIGVIPVRRYDTKENLLAVLDKAIISPVLEMRNACTTIDLRELNWAWKTR